MFGMGLPPLVAPAPSSSSGKDGTLLQSPVQESDNEDNELNGERDGGECERFQAKTLECRDCGRNFVFTAEDQRLMAKRGFTQDRSRCTACAQLKKNRFSARPADADGQRGPTKGKGGGKGKGKGKGKSGGKGKGCSGHGSDDAPERLRNLCQPFQLGACKRGSACKFMHVLERFRHMLD